MKSGSGGEIRTPDMVINSHPLCQLSYAGTDFYKLLVKQNNLYIRSI